MEDSVSIIVGPSTMKERVMEAAQEGDIEALYELIREKPDVLRQIDGTEFVDTPLHLAAKAGHTEFAIELMGLKPSLATKLNQYGLTPIHLALLNGNSDTALSLFKFNKSLVRVKGKNGYTPLHYAVMKEYDPDVLTKFLGDCPECIHDFTNRNETALHVAAEKNNLEAIRVLLKSLYSSDCSMAEINEILNFKNRAGNTVLHIAASNNQPEIVWLLTRTRINLKATNSKNLTALDILLQGWNQEENKECLKILRSAQLLEFFLIPSGVVERFSQMAYDVRSTKDEKSNTLLVVAVLILTATYQATLSPPGGVFEANSHPQDNTTTSTDMQIHSGSNKTSSHLWDLRHHRNPLTAGSSVLNTAPFLWFFIPNIAAFCISFFVTCFVLISTVHAVFWSTLVVGLFMLLFCLLISALLIISPNSESAIFMFQYIYILAYFLAAVFNLIVLIVVVMRLRFRRFNKRCKITKTKKFECGRYSNMVK